MAIEKVKGIVVAHKEKKLDRGEREAEILYFDEQSKDEIDKLKEQGYKIEQYRILESDEENFKSEMWSKAHYGYIVEKLESKLEKAAWYASDISEMKKIIIKNKENLYQLTKKAMEHETTEIITIGKPGEKGYEFFELNGEKNRKKIKDAALNLQKLERYIVRKSDVPRFNHSLENEHKIKKSMNVLKEELINTKTPEEKLRLEKNIQKSEKFISRQVKDKQDLINAGKELTAQQNKGLSI